VAPQCALAKRRASESRELHSYLAAGGIPCGARGEKRAARLEHQRANLRRLDPEHLRDLGVTQRVKLGEDEGRPLRLRQSPEVADQRAQVLTPLDLL
jgi:hypothetical protein